MTSPQSKELKCMGYHCSANALDGDIACELHTTRPSKELPTIICGACRFECYDIELMMDHMQENHPTLPSKEPEHQHSLMPDGQCRFVDCPDPPQLSKGSEEPKVANPPGLDEIFIPVQMDELEIPQWWIDKTKSSLTQFISNKEREAQQKLEEALLQKILYIGEELPESVATDPRPKFVVLGTPNELLTGVNHKRGGGE